MSSAIFASLMAFGPLSPPAVTSKSGTNAHATNCADRLSRWGFGVLRNAQTCYALSRGGGRRGAQAANLKRHVKGAPAAPGVFASLAFFAHRSSVRARPSRAAPRAARHAPGISLPTPAGP